MTDPKFLALDHIGIVVSNLEESIKLYTEQLGFTLKERELLKDSYTELVFLESAESTIELLYSHAQGEQKSTVKRFLETRGPGLHHLCYRVDNIEQSLAAFKAQGFDLIDEKPRAGARGSRIAFIHPKSAGGVLLELADYPAKL